MSPAIKKSNVGYSTGSGLVYSTYLGGSGTDEGAGIAVDTSGNAYLTGITESTDFPTTNEAFQTTFGGNGDAFVSELDPTGSAVAYSTFLGGGIADGGAGVAVDTSGNAYVTGFGYSTYFPTTAGVFQETNHGYIDAFVAKFGATTRCQIVVVAQKHRVRPGQ